MRTTANIDAHYRLEKLSDHYPKNPSESHSLLGWSVVLEDDTEIGLVEDLLVNPSSERVRYLIVQVVQAVPTIQSKKFLIPIGLAEAHLENDVVILRGVEQGHLERLPDYHYQEIDDEIEISIRKVFGPATHQEFTQPISHAFYDHAQFDLNRLYQNRKQNG